MALPSSMTMKNRWCPSDVNCRERCMRIYVLQTGDWLDRVGAPLRVSFLIVAWPVWSHLIVSTSTPPASRLREPTETLFLEIEIPRGSPTYIPDELVCWSK